MIRIFVAKFCQFIKLSTDVNIEFTGTMQNIIMNILFENFLFREH